MEIDRIRVMQLNRPGLAGAAMADLGKALGLQKMFCRPSLAKVGGGWPAVDGRGRQESILVLWYRFIDLARPRCEGGK
jgi:hypothetical protein